MRVITLLCVSILCLISGCVSETKEEVLSMPKEIPSDFNFSIKFGVNKNNEINTFENIVKKDLIEDGKATANITFTKEEMNNIYEQMKEINVLETKQLIPDTTCVQEPHEDDDWKIIMNGETITHSVSGQYCETTQDGEELISLRNYVLRIVKSKDEYTELPEARGGYD